MKVFVCLTCLMLSTRAIGWLTEAARSANQSTVAQEPANQSAAAHELAHIRDTAQPISAQQLTSSLLLEAQLRSPSTDTERGGRLTAAIFLKQDSWPMGFLCS
ncbi:hypothetical protein NQD34_017477 [Periophthalmus magnuspinnatus]|nr:hypothetical protein NQD34_017477 [Periophthalmus magnuspinnatus]